MTSTLTWRSSMASSSALCVLGLARFTSSASSSCVNTGPFLNEKPPLAESNTETPMMSAGSRSLVNCTRCQARPSTCASAWASVVLPTPGHVFDEQVAARQQAGEREAHRLGFAEDHAVECAQRGGEGGVDGEVFTTRL